MNAIEAGAFIVAQQLHAELGADARDLAMEVMTPVEAQDLRAAQMVDMQVWNFRQWMVGGGDQKQAFAKQRLYCESATFDGQGTEQHVERTAGELKRLLFRNTLLDMQPQIGLLAMQRSNNRRH